MVSRDVKKGANKEKLWERGNTGRFWKGTTTPGGGDFKTSVSLNDKTGSEKG